MAEQTPLERLVTQALYPDNGWGVEPHPTKALELRAAARTADSLDRIATALERLVELEGLRESR